MAQASVQVQLSIPELYEMLCKECKSKLKKLVREKITDQMVSQVIGER